MSTYLYRCTEQQLEQHLQRIAEAGDTVEHVIYKGGRDYVLVCREASEEARVTVISYSPEAMAQIREACAAAAETFAERLSRAARRADRGDL